MAMRSRWILSLASLVFGVWATLTSPVAAQNLIANGSFEQVGDGSSVAPGWKLYRWDGEGSFEVSEADAAEGRRSLILKNDGSGKSAAFQSLKLAPCSYRISGVVASFGLVPGLWNQSTTVHIAIEGQGETSQRLLTGTTNWTEFEWDFELTAPRSVTIYLFNYGTGHFLVDDIRLTAAANCERRPARFALGQFGTARLKFEPPVTPDDMVLAGYCTDAALAAGPMCRRLARAQIQPASRDAQRMTRVLDDFERGGSQSSFSGLQTTRRPAISGGQSAYLAAGKYIIAKLDGAAGDWRGYDWLRFEVQNSGDRPEPVSIEIGDTQSRDYWSRVNWTSSAAPGRSTIHVPLQAFVGERVMVRERRKLDLAKVTRLVISAAGSKTDLIVDDVRMERDPDYTYDFPRLIKLDVGPSTAPRMPGFHVLSPATTYSALRGFGIAPGTQIGRVENRRHPDSLLGDWISFNSGGLDFDLPDGSYDVWLMLEDPGYWESYPNFRYRRVLAQGRAVLDEQQTAATFLEKYLAHSDDEDLPGDNIWRRYIKRRYVPLRFETVVDKGKLAIRFVSDGTPVALALSALVISPTTERKRAEGFIEEVWARLEREFDQRHIQVVPRHSSEASPPANALDGALTVFQTNDGSLSIKPSYRAKREDLVTRLDIELARDETKPVAIGLNSLHDLELVEARARIPGIQVEASSVRLKVTRSIADGTVFENLPRVLDPLPAADRRAVNLPAGLSRTILLELTGLPSASAGITAGHIDLIFADGSVHALPVSVKLHDWKLPPADIPVGYMGVGTIYPGSPFSELEARRLRELPIAVDLLQRHGATAATGGLGGPKFIGYEAGRIRMDFRAADASMTAVAGRFIGGHNTYLGMGISGLATNRPADTSRYGKPYHVVLRDALLAIVAHGASRSWPELEHVVGDEPRGEQIDETVAVAEAFRAALPTARTAVFTSIRDPDRDPTRKLAGVVGRLYLTDHNRRAIEHVISQGSECALYNQEGRFRQGIYLFKARHVGCRGHLKFAANSVGSDPWYDLDSREMEHVAYLPHRDGTLRRVLALAEFRQALNDYRYLLKLEQAIRAAPQGSEKTAAQHWLSRLLASIEVDSRAPDAIPQDRLDKLQREIAERISLLVR